MQYKTAFKQAYAPKENTLQIPKFSIESIEKLFSYHAPQWRVLVNDRQESSEESNNETNKQIDPINLIGSPQFNQTWFINTQQARVFTHPSFTFFKGKKLLQLNYLIWFPQAQYSQTGIDWYGGEFDGVYWRVTLDTDGEVLLYDSIHACGCYHTVFINPHKIGWKPTDKSEPPILAPTPWVNGPVRLTLTRQQHWLIGVSAQEEKLNSNITLKPLSMKSMDSLRSMQTPQGYKSFYNNQGFVKGSERNEHFFLWPFGVDNAGAMRQWGQHATAFIGKRHFDDANWLDDFFERIKK